MRRFQAILPTQIIETRKQATSVFLIGTVLSDQFLSLASIILPVISPTLAPFSADFVYFSIIFSGRFLYILAPCFGHVPYFNSTFPSCS